MRRTAVTAAVLAVVLATAACGQDSEPGGDDGPLKVGQIVSLTGNYAPLGTENEKSVKLAVEQVNAAGGVLGRQIELLVRDDKSQPDQSVLAFNDLKGRDVAAVIGSPFSNSALATIPLVDREKIPYVSLTPADEQVDPVHPYVFVVPATSGTYADRILQYLKAQNISRVAVAYDGKSSYARAGFNGTKAKAAGYGITLTATPEFQTTTTEFSAVFNQVRSSGAQALVVWATGPPGVALAKQFPTANLGVPVVFTGAQASKLWLEPVGAAAEGAVVASSIGVVGDSLPDGAQKKAIAELAEPFEKQHGYPPPQFAQDGYSGVKLLVAAIEKAGSTEPEKIQAALEGLTATTPNGTYTYSATDHAGLKADYISINTVKGGALVPTEWSAEQLATVAGR
ncbi:ABC transporter substrate-binding protein [Micromonospora sp. WMMD1102]|uniref:ABC transporter substrate-binding protein n=1 Tax=Micromonospora sp. WMMD1102 TaxID=3016105 RepID=UPI002415962F|nr:ABC transporter substrate-binding protein [Micromonospora sp. WMMD1102]MDG4785336.1 ABC transporter substrate-binding protein [Micromonospora sp. WMMD1102]